MSFGTEDSVNQFGFKLSCFKRLNFSWQIFLGFFLYKYIYLNRHISWSPNHCMTPFFTDMHPLYINGWSVCFVYRILYLSHSRLNNYIFTSTLYIKFLQEYMFCYILKVGIYIALVSNVALLQKAWLELTFDWSLISIFKKTMKIATNKQKTFR